MRSAFIFASCVLLLACEDGSLSRLTPNLAVDPDPIVFDETAVGTSKRLTVAVANKGSAALEISSVAIEGSDQLTLDAPGLPGSVAVGVTRELSLELRPTSLAASEAFLVITSDDPDEPVKRVPILAP